MYENNVTEDMKRFIMSQSQNVGQKNLGDVGVCSDRSSNPGQALTVLVL